VTGGGAQGIVVCFFVALFVSWFLEVKHYGCMFKTQLFVCAIFVLLGIAMVVFFIIVKSNPVEYEQFISSSTSTWGILVGSFIVVFQSLGIFGALKTNGGKARKTLLIFTFVLLLMVIVEGIAIVTVTIWTDALGSAEANTDSESVVVDSTTENSEVKDVAFADLLTDLQGFACRTYQSCCWERQRYSMGNQTRCAQAHSGSAVGAGAGASQDPSAPTFCEQVTGSTTKETPDAGLCALLQDGGVFQLSECSANYCVDGIEGYVQFMNGLTNWVRDQTMPLALSLGLFSIGQVTQLVVSLKLMFLFHKVGGVLGSFFPAYLRAVAFCFLSLSISCCLTRLERLAAASPRSTPTRWRGSSSVCRGRWASSRAHSRSDSRSCRLAQIIKSRRHHLGTRWLQPIRGHEMNVELDL
jgi:hypothetical protein